MINFSHLEPEVFEEFCYDLIKEKGFINVSWRRGSGKQSSPSDSGRDIVASYAIKDPDHEIRNEQYFIECKHYIEGVPPSALSGALTWAAAERPDVLLIIVSNFLSNPCKDYIKQYIAGNRPSFRIKIWENKDLEILISDNAYLMDKYKLSGLNTSLKYVNRYHLMYIIKPKLNSIAYLIELLDKFDPLIRDNILSFCYHFTIKPRYRTPISGEERIGDLLIDSVDYKSFRKKVLALAEDEGPSFVHQIICEALSWAFSMADKSDIELMKKRHSGMIRFAKDKLAEPQTEKDKRALEGIIDFSKDKLENIEDEYEKRFIEYTRFCECVIQNLLLEEEKIL